MGSKQSAAERTRERGRDISRLEGFSDAVFGFAATLLVVSLEVPKTYPELLENLSGFAAFGLSFMALILIWAGHNAFFRRYGLTDPWTIVLNSLLLFVVLFYVYPLKFMANGMVQFLFGIGVDGGAGVATVDELVSLFSIYGAGFVAVFLCMVFLHVHAYRMAEELQLTELERAVARASIGYYLIYVAVGVASIVLSQLRIGLPIAAPGWIYAMLGPLCALHGRRTQAEQERIRAVEVG